MFGDWHGQFAADEIIDGMLEKGIKDKIALFCNVPKEHVLQNLDVEYLYEAPLAMEQEHLAQAACECLTYDTLDVPANPYKGI